MIGTLPLARVGQTRAVSVCLTARCSGVDCGSWFVGLFRSGYEHQKATYSHQQGQHALSSSIPTNVVQSNEDDPLFNITLLAEKAQQKVDLVYPQNGGAA